MSVPSASEANAVIPTTEPFAAFSETAFVELFVSVMVEIGN
jgi:hypothetical protein